MGSDTYWLRLIPDPGSDEVICATLDNAKDINVFVWNGTSWGGVTQIETDTNSASYRQFDVAYEPDGSGDALCVCMQNGSNLPRYRTFDGTSWSGESTGPSLGAEPRIIQLRTRHGSDRIHIAASDSGRDLEMLEWNGTTMTGPQVLETDMGGSTADEQFMMAIPRPRVVTWGEVKGY